MALTEKELERRRKYAEEHGPWNTDPVEVRHRVVLELLDSGNTNLALAVGNTWNIPDQPGFFDLVNHRD